MKQFFSGSFLRTAVFVIVVASLPAVGIVVFTGMERNTFALHRAEERAASTVHLVAEAQETITAGAKTLLSTLALTDPVQNRSSDLSSFLERLDEQTPAYTKISVREGHEQALPASPGMPQFSLPASRLGFMAGMDPFPPTDGYAALYFGYRFTGKSDKDLTLETAIRTEYYTYLLRQLNLLPGSKLYLLDMQWREVFSLSSPPTQAEPFRPEVGKAVEDRGTAEELFYMSLSGEKALVAFERLFLEEENTPYLQVVYVVPEKTLLAEATSLLYRDIAFLALAFVGMLFLAVVLVQAVFSPSVKQLFTAAKAYGEGDYTARPHLSGSCAELRELGRSMNAMADALQRRESDLINARDAAMDADKSKSEFLANMSHEIRTPMNAIIGMAYLTLKGELSPRQRGYINRIHESGTILLRVINDILELSKLDAGKVGVEAIPFALREMFAECLRRFILPAQEKGLSLNIDIAKDVPRHVVGDPLRLGQILGHLLDNAVSHTETGGVTVGCVLEGTTPSGVVIRISVADTGPGISEEQTAALNHLFTGESESLPEINAGKGFGLLLSQKLITVMGGSIAVESRAGFGTTFTVRVSLGIRTRERTVSLESLQDIRVLAVDDDPVALGILRDLLHTFRMRVEVEEIPEKTFELLSAADDENDPFHLVILDWRMPTMNGVELTRRIKEKTDLNFTPAIIMLSAYGWDGIALQAEQAGADAFLHKPLNESVLLDTIMNLMQVQEIKLPAAKEQPSAENATDLNGLRTLVVEDNLVNQQIAREILEGVGVAVTLAINGEDALKLFDPDAQDPPYDLVLMDLQMPVMDGFEATRKLRAVRAPWAGDIPIIAMTAHSRDLEFETSMKAGLNDHVSKPISVDDFFATIRRWLPLRPLEDSETAGKMRHLYSLLAMADSSAASYFEREKPALLKHLFPGRVALLEERIRENDLAGAADILRRCNRILLFMQGGSA